MYQTQWYATMLCVQFFLVKSVCKIAWTVAIDPPQSLVHRVDHRQMDSLDNGLAANRRQAIIWTNDDPVQRRIYASLGLNELTPNFLLMNCLNIFLSLVVMHFFFPWVGSVVNVSTQFTTPVSYIGREKVDLQHLILQHSWGLKEMAAILQTTFSYFFHMQFTVRVTCVTFVIVRENPGAKLCTPGTIHALCHKNLYCYESICPWASYQFVLFYVTPNYTSHFNEVESGVYWFHLVHPAVRPAVRLWTESCPLCIFNNTRRIHFIFTHLIKQLQKVCCVYSVYQN